MLDDLIALAEHRCAEENRYWEVAAQPGENCRLGPNFIFICSSVRVHV
jgi:hypothetical protein